MIPILLVIVLLIFVSCNDPNSSPSNNSDLIIKAGFICGWGSGTDTIVISKSMISYVYYIPKKSNIPQIIKTRDFSDSEWNDILNCINYDKFTKLKYNECNYCFDGCDDWILIENNQLSHKITYAQGKFIDTISKLQIKIEELRNEFKK
jgi:hypothetical protein